MSTRQHKLSNDHHWAKDSINRLLAGCYLNIELKQQGLCERFICEMSNDEIIEYCDFLAQFYSDRTVI